MGKLSDRLERATQAKSLDTLESQIVLFEAKKGRIDFKHGFYAGDHIGPEDQQPFMSHVLFAMTKHQDTSFIATQRGEPYRYVPKHALGHLYHSFPPLDEIEDEIRPQPFRVKIPVFHLRGLKHPLTTRLDLLNPSHLGGVGSLEGMCVKAIALSVNRSLEGIPETVQDPGDHLIEKIA